MTFSIYVPPMLWTVELNNLRERNYTKYTDMTLTFGRKKITIMISMEKEVIGIMSHNRILRADLDDLIFSDSKQIISDR